MDDDNTKQIIKEYIPYMISSFDYPKEFAVSGKMPKSAQLHGLVDFALRAKSVADILKKIKELKARKAVPEWVNVSGDLNRNINEIDSILEGDYFDPWININLSKINTALKNITDSKMEIKPEDLKGSLTEADKLELARKFIIKFVDLALIKQSGD